MRLFSALIAAALLASASSAQTLTHVRVEHPDAQTLAVELESAGLDVVEGSVQPGSLELIVSPTAMEYVLGLGLEPRTIAVGRPYRDIQAEALGAEGEDAVPSGYSTLADIVADLGTVEATFPSIAKRVNLTQLYGVPQTWEGRDIYGLLISDNVNVDEDEPAVLIVAAHHCREINTPVVLMEAINRLTQGYGLVPGIQNLVDSNEILIVPVWNVDGYEYVFSTNNMWRKNRRNNGNGTFGVDLNRNYPAGWTAGCSGSTNTGSDTYKGPSASSEPETVLMEAITADRRFAKVYDFHSSGRETLWGYNCAVHSWDGFFLAVAKTLSMNGGYGTAQRRPSAEGEQYEWQINRGVMAYLTEIGTSFQPAFTSAQAEAVQLWPAIQWLLQAKLLFTGHVTDSCSGAPIEAAIDFQGVTSPYGGSWSSGGPFGRFDLEPAPGTYNVEFSAPGYLPQVVNVTVTPDSPVTMEIALVPTSTVAVNYCTAGTTENGCTATLSAAGAASLSSASGFDVSTSTAEGGKDGLYFFSTNGRKANSWGNGTSFQCVVPPVQRTPLITGTGTSGACDGNLGIDFNAWMTANPSKAPAAGSTVDMQLWFRDPGNTSNQTTSFSDGIEFGVCP